MADPKQFYRFLLKLYPARFREEYEAPLERQFRDEYGEARGFWARVFFWLRALSDLAISVPAEFARWRLPRWRWPSVRPRASSACSTRC
jgi:hypothetical protein